VIVAMNPTQGAQSALGWASSSLTTTTPRTYTMMTLAEKVRQERKLLDDETATTIDFAMYVCQMIDEWDELDDPERKQVTDFVTDKLILCELFSMELAPLDLLCLFHHFTIALRHMTVATLSPKDDNGTRTLYDHSQRRDAPCGESGSQTS
jgi:hypothetical protein